MISFARKLREHQARRSLKALERLIQKDTSIALGLVEAACDAAAWAQCFSDSTAFAKIEEGLAQLLLEARG